MATNDPQLVARARSGDAHAYASLLDRHQARLLRTCARIVGEPGVAADIAQEAALVAWLQLGRLRDPAHFGAWLTGIGRNLALSSARERSARSEPAFDEASMLDRLAAETDDPHQRLLARERAAELAAAISALPRGQRDAVVLFHLADLPQEAVAARLHTGVGAVRTRLHKARATLRTRLSATSPIENKEPVMTQTHLPATITDVRRTPAGRHVVLLATDEGELPIWIGASDAETLAAGLHDVQRPRPNTHALALSLIRACGRAAQHVRITRLDDAIFYAEVVLDDGTAVDARPSDALVLAVAANVPIEIDTAVFAATREPLPDTYAQDLAHATTDGAARLAEEARAEIAARADELRTLRD